MINYTVHETFPDSHEYYLLYDNNYILFPLKEFTPSETVDHSTLTLEYQVERLRSINNLYKYKKVFDLEELRGFFYCIKVFYNYETSIKIDVPSTSTTYACKRSVKLEKAFLGSISIRKAEKEGDYNCMVIYPNYTYSFLHENDKDFNTKGIEEYLRMKGFIHCITLK